MTATDPKTHPEEVYASLRGELLSGTFLPGSKLKLAADSTAQDLWDLGVTGRLPTTIVAPMMATNRSAAMKSARGFRGEA